MHNDDLAVDRAASFLRTRPPVDEEGEQVGCADGAVVVEVGGTAFAWLPTCQQREQIGQANSAVVNKIPQALSGGGSVKEVCRSGDAPPSIPRCYQPIPIETAPLTTTPLSNRESESSTAGFRAPDRNLEGSDRHPDLSAGTESPGTPGRTLP